MVRLIQYTDKFAYIKKYLVFMRSGGVSTNGLKGYLNNLNEANIVLKNNNIKFPYLINFIRIFKTILQGLNAKILKKKILNKIKSELKEG